MIKPATLLKFHRALVKHKYRRLFSNSGYRRPGPKGPSQELIAAIVELKRRNPRFGCPRIAHIITLTFGIDINKDVVRRVLANHFNPAPGHTQGHPGSRCSDTARTVFGASICFDVNP